MNSKQTYRCWAEIDRDALLHNLAIVRERIGGAEILVVVKANAYGHGMVGVCETVAKEVQLFGVANLEEAVALRAAGLPHPVIILGPSLAAERSSVVEGNFKFSILVSNSAADSRIGPSASAPFLTLAKKNDCRRASPITQ